MMLAFQQLKQVFVLRMVVTLKQLLKMTDIIDGKILRKYEIVKKIGKGAYGQVWKVFDKQAKTTCALKKIYDAFRNITDCQRTYRQIMYLKELKHSCIIHLNNYYQSSNEKDVYVSLEFMESDLAVTLKNQFLKDIHKQYIFTQVSHAIYYLHSGDLIHRDIKPSNILVNANCDAKLCDFGLVRSINKQNQEKLVLTQNIATRWYKAPELLLSSNCYGKGIDIWSLGCILAEMFLGKPIFQGNSAFHQLEEIISLTGKPQKDLKHVIQSQTSLAILQSLEVSKTRHLEQMFQSVDPLIVDLLSKIFKFDPLDRLTIQEIIDHPYLLRFKSKIQIKKPSEPFKIKYDEEVLNIEEYKTLLFGTKNTGIPKENPQVHIEKLSVLKSIKSKGNLQLQKNMSEKQKKFQTNFKETSNNKSKKSISPNNPNPQNSSKFLTSPSYHPPTPTKNQKISLLQKNKSPVSRPNKNISPTISNIKSPKSKNLDFLNSPINSPIKTSPQIKLTFSPKSKMFDEKSFKLSSNQKKQQVNHQIATSPKQGKIHINNSSSPSNFYQNKAYNYTHTSPGNGQNSSIKMKTDQIKQIVKKYEGKTEQNKKIELKQKSLKFEAKYIKR